MSPPGSVFPGAEWEAVADVEKAGFGGRVLFSYGNVAETSKIASVRKSVLGMLFGK